MPTPHLKSKPGIYSRKDIAAVADLLGFENTNNINEMVITVDEIRVTCLDVDNWDNTPSNAYPAVVHVFNVTK